MCSSSTLTARVAKFALSGVAFLALTAAAEAGTVRLTVAEYSAKTGPYFEEVAKDFEAANPDIQVEIEVVPWDSLLQKLTTDISAGTNADLSIIGTRWLLDFVQQDIAEPLDGYMDAAFKDRFISTFLTPSVLDGKTYGLPIAASARALYYNKSLFEQAGIAAPPANWTELESAAKKISGLGGGVFGFGLQGKEIETDVYYYYAMWAEGAEIVTDGKSGLSSPGAIKAAKLYKSLIDEKATQPGVTSNSREDVQNLFKQGKLGMVITAPFLSNQIRDEAPDLKYGVAAIPSGEGGAKGTYGVTDSIVLFKNSKNKDEAFKLLDFLFQTPQRVAFTVGEGFLPVEKEESQDPHFTDSADLKVFTSLLPDARFAPVITGWEEIADVTSNALQSIYLGKAEVEPALTEAAAKADAILAK